MPPPLPRCSGRAHSSLKLPHPYQPSPKPLSGRSAHRPFRGLLSVHSRCGLHTRAVTKTVTVIRRLQTFRLLHACSGCFRLERSPGGACTRWKSAALSRRTWIANIKASGDYRVVGDLLSYEPYGLAFRKDDFQFADIVERTFQKIAKTGEIVRLYEKWFVKPLPSGVSLNLPMSGELGESFRALALMGY